MPANCPFFTIEVSAGPPVDYSFKNLQTLAGRSCGRPRAVRLRKIPCTGCTGRFVTRSVWLNNNCLTSLHGVSNFVSGVVEQPNWLGWLDLSHNFLTDIHPEILCFPQLRILYLHGNLICSMCSLAKLRNLRCLRTLTLHGNPIEAARGYRVQVVHLLPQVRSLDFAPVVRRERRVPVPGGKRCWTCAPVCLPCAPCGPCVPHPPAAPAPPPAPCAPTTCDPAPAPCGPPCAPPCAEAKPCAQPCA